MLIKTAELTGTALDWAVAKCNEPELGVSDFTLFRDSADGGYRCSTNWGQGGPIIEREKITILHVDDHDPEPLDDGNWCAGTPNADVGYTGTTLLIAAMRCFVASKLGDNVEIPEELL